MATLQQPTIAKRRQSTTTTTSSPAPTSGGGAYVNRSGGSSSIGAAPVPGAKSTPTRPPAPTPAPTPPRNTSVYANQTGGTTSIGAAPVPGAQSTQLGPPPAPGAPPVATQPPQEIASAYLNQMGGSSSIGAAPVPGAQSTQLGPPPASAPKPAPSSAGFVNTTAGGQSITSTPMPGAKSTPITPGMPPPPSLDAGKTAPPPGVQAEVEQIDEAKASGEPVGYMEEPWAKEMSSTLAEHESQKQDILDLTYEDEARMARQASAQAARLGYSAGGGGYGAAMAQAAMSGEQMRTRALMEHQQRGLDLRQSFLQKMFDRAVQEDDQDMQTWVQNEQNKTLRETTFIDAMLNAAPETLEEARKSGALGGIGEMIDRSSGGGGGAGGGEGGEGGWSEALGKSSKKLAFGDKELDPDPSWKNVYENKDWVTNSRMNNLASKTNLPEDDILYLEDRVMDKIVHDGSAKALFDWWDKHPDVDRMELYNYVEQALTMRRNDPKYKNTDIAFKADDILDNIKDKAEGVTLGDAADAAFGWIPGL